MPYEDLDMGARRDLGHHAAERRMAVLLAEQRLAQHPAPAVDHGDRGLVAAGLDAEHHWGSHRVGSFGHDVRT